MPPLTLPPTLHAAPSRCLGLMEFTAHLELGSCTVGCARHRACGRKGGVSVGSENYWDEPANTMRRLTDRANLSERMSRGAVNDLQSLAGLPAFLVYFCTAIV